MDLNHLIHMGGYGVYVWPSYAIWLLIVVYNVWSALRLRADARRQAVRRTQAAATRAPNPTTELSKEGV